MKDLPKRIGLMGCGAVANYGHLPAIDETEGLILHAVFDPSEEALQRVQKKYGLVTKELLAKEAKRSLKVAAYYLVDLKKARLVKCVDTPKKNGRMQSHVYVVKK